LKKIAPAWANTTTVGKAVDLPTTTTRRTLEELVAYGLAKRDSQGQGKTDLWRTV
jgi:DNA-binding IclR family transcriptional regulator